MDGDASDLTSTTATYLVDGMTCGHCVSAVQVEIGQLAGVTSVQVDLHAGQPSPVTVASVAPLTIDQLTAALDEAGDYRLLPSTA